jgi:hypothetical protein
VTREAKAGDAVDAYDDPGIKRGERTLEVERAVLMDRLFRTIEAPWRVLMGDNKRHIYLGSPPLPNGGSYVVVLEPKSDGSNEFVTAHPRSKEWLASMRAPGQRAATPHGPLIKSETPPRDGVSGPVLHGVTGPAGPTLFAESPAASASTREDRPGVASEDVAVAFSFFKALAPGERWITVRPNGPGTEGHPLLIKLGRFWTGIDITHLAISLIERRLKDAFPAIVLNVHGRPKDMDGARDLARRDKYQFQWWALSLIEAQPFAGRKKGADGGVDGIIYFRSDPRTMERAIVSVKGGGAVGVPMIRDLKGVLAREKAPIGIFLTLTPPTRPMEAEAASAGLYEQGGRQYPRIQIITIAAALSGAKPAIPLVDAGAGYRRAPREQADDQRDLDL